MPIFKDGIAYPKPVLFTWQIDEKILLIGHFCNPILILLSILFLFFGSTLKTEKQITTIGFLIFFLILEIGVRFLASYDYIMFD